jgi:hypothetical protein
MRCAEHATCTGDMKNIHRILVRKTEGKRPLRRPRRRWENNIRMGIREVEWEGVDWMYTAQDRDQWLVVVNTVMNLRVQQKAGNFLTT